jgi:hypothetical protein
MKIMFVFIVFLVCFLPLNIYSGESYTPPPYDKIVNVIMSRSGKRLAKKHGLRQIGITEGMMDCVRLMGFSFQIFRSMDKQESRAMLVDCVQDFLSDINGEEKIRPYLEVYPFDANHVEITIYLKTPDRGSFYHPNFTVVTAYKGEIVYSTVDQKTNKYKSQEVETFEEAVEILKGECPQNHMISGNVIKG